MALDADARGELGTFTINPIMAWPVQVRSPRPLPGASARRSTRRRLQLHDVRDAVSLPSVFQYLLQRWRAELSCALVLGDVDVYFAALQGVPPRGGEPPPVETHVYDLQSYRSTY